MKMSKYQTGGPENVISTVSAAKSACVLDVETTGRYYRTTRITKLSVLSYHENEWVDTVYTADCEEDEYEILQRFGNDLTETVLTYNGQAFDLPYLRRKLCAYSLADPLPGRTYCDLMIRYRGLARFLSLPGRHLDDFAAFLGCGGKSETEKTLRLLSLESYFSMLRGGYRIREVSRRPGPGSGGELLIFSLDLRQPVPREVIYRDDPYRIQCSGSSAVLSVSFSDGRVKRFYPDYENYEYLPIEDYAVHKSLASAIPSSRREKASRSTSFQYLSADLLLSASSEGAPQENAHKKEERQLGYLSSAMTYLTLPLSVPQQLPL